MKRTATNTPLKKHIQAFPEQEKLIHKRKRSRMRFVGVTAILFVVLVVTLTLLTRLNRIQILHVEVSGNQVIDSDVIAARVQADIAGHYGYIVPRKNAFLYPKAKILADLHATFPRLSSISVYRTNLHTILVTVTEERGDALWCGTGVAQIDYTAPCYFVDAGGTIIDTAPLYSGAVYPRFFGGVLNGTQPLGARFIDQASYDRLIAFDQSVRQLGFSIKAISIGPGDEDSFVINLDGTNTALIHFKADDNYDTLLANLKAALGKGELSTQLAKDRANLEYFDLRFTDKVYYRFSDDAATAPVAPSVPVTTD